MNKFFPFVITCFFFAGLLAIGCEHIGETIAVSETATLGVTPTLTFTVTPIPTQTPLPTFTTIPSPTPINPDTGWELVRPNLERRIINLFDDHGKHVEYLYVVRLEPRHYQLDVAYHQEPQTLEAWQAETDAIVVMNGGYFRQEDGICIPNGLTVVDGKVMGSSYAAFAGMLAVTNDGPELRWLAQKPYDPDEPLLAALQSFPLLVKPGGEIGFSEEYEDNRQARRTVIGQDGNGRTLFIVASRGYFTLHQLSAYLTSSDLDLDIAINLDGGPSSGMLLASPSEKVSAFALLPIVITVHSR